MYPQQQGGAPWQSQLQQQQPGEAGALLQLENYASQHVV
jgi:hypothetical protein